ncbi:hypothetical protein P152DRAFT_378326, partial [Eremomyces bilateralis CBS 781.70]
PLTPQDEDVSMDQQLPWTPHDIPYSESFENSLMTAVLEQSTPSDAPPPTATPPPLTRPELPLPLSDPRRTHPLTAFPQIKLTHPTGWATGGAGPSPETQIAFATALVSRRRVRNEDGLRRALEEDRAAQVMGLWNRSKERQHAVEQNARVRRELETLVAQREMEVRLEQRIR